MHSGGYVLVRGTFPVLVLVMHSGGHVLKRGTYPVLVLVMHSLGDHGLKRGTFPVLVLVMHSGIMNETFVSDIIWISLTNPRTQIKQSTLDEF